ncbi:MAG: 4'-phosphopantetheinyl transferase superfamily protein [Lysobacterales bacterium]
MSNNAKQSAGRGLFSPVSLPLRQLEKPAEDEVHLWHLDFCRLSNPLSGGEAGCLDGLSVFQQNTVRRFYLRLLLGAYMGIPGRDVRINRRLKGRPELDAAQSGGKLDFSVARSKDSYLVGISNGATIGVDLEIADRRSGKPLALARRYFSAAETEALSALQGEELQRAFMHAWACKEAVVKASGLGIANQLCRFSVDVNPEAPPAMLDMLDDDPSQWRLAVVRPDSWAIAAVAVRQAELNLRGFRLES